MTPPVISAVDTVPQIAKYELLEPLGHGGMATVYRARDRRLGRDVAVKLIHRHLRESPEVARRFVSEARAVAMLRHPNIVEVFDVSDETDAEHYLVTELVRGCTLRHLLAKHGALPPEVAAAVGIEVGAALSHAHAQGIIHRDVKPENVLLELPRETPSAREPREGREGRDRELLARIKLTDFGIAKLLDAQGVTSTGQVLGSPAHMAPEQIEGGTIAETTDVFGLGVLLYEAMVGRLPFEGANPAQVLRRVLEGDCAPPEREVPTVGSRYGGIVLRALSRDASGRPPSVDALTEELRSELERLGMPEPRRILESFLADPKGFAEEHATRVVAALMRAGTQARERRDIATATAAFSRALAYRPGDPELLRQVSGMARGVLLRRAGLGLVALAALAAGAGWAVHRARERDTVGAASPPGGVAAPRASDAHLSRLGSSAGALPSVVPSTVVQPTVVPGVTTPPGAALAAPAATRSSAPGPAPQNATAPHVEARAHAPASGGKPAGAATRQVQLVLMGHKNGQLTLDGRPVEWFGVQHALSVGPHVVAFQPKDTQCCQPLPPTTVTVDTGTDVQRIRLTTLFRDAVVRVVQAPAGRVTCPLFFSGDLIVPGSRTVPMSAAEAVGHCTLTPADPLAGQLARKSITLTAGAVVQVVWP